MTIGPPSKKRAVFSIPAGVSFATALVHGINMLVDDDQAELARALILVPSRRAARSLRLAFLEVNGDKAMLLPRMLPIGDVDEDDPALLDPILHEPEFMVAGTDLFPPVINPCAARCCWHACWRTFHWEDSFQLWAGHDAGEIPCRLY